MRVAMLEHPPALILYRSISMIIYLYVKTHNKTGKNNPMYGKISPNKGKTPIKLECPHCKKLISRGNYTKWHGDKCKFNYKIS